MNKKLLLITVFILTFTGIAKSQHDNTSENAMHKDTTSFLSRTSLGGYGNARYVRDFNEKHSIINLDRFVLFLGHKFSKKISLFTELEFEDAKVSGGEEGGEVALEQCYLKFNVNSNNYFVAGLFLPRVGILNEAIPRSNPAPRYRHFARRFRRWALTAGWNRQSQDSRG